VPVTQAKRCNQGSEHRFGRAHLGAGKACAHVADVHLQPFQADKHGCAALRNCRAVGGIMLDQRVRNTAGQLGHGRRIVPKMRVVTGYTVQQVAHDNDTPIRVRGGR
jgi:hypothetical protein